MVERSSGSRLVVTKEAVSPPNHEGLKHLSGIDFKRLILQKLPQLDIAIDPQELNIMEPPKPHDNGSEALYFLEQFIGNDWVLVSFLGPRSKTSEHSHSHPAGTEQYYSLAGEATLIVGTEKQILNRENNFRVVPVDTLHQLTTKKNSFALTLLVMKNAKLVPPDKLHVPAPKRIKFK